MTVENQVFHQSLVHLGHSFVLPEHAVGQKIKQIKLNPEKQKSLSFQTSGLCCFVPSKQREDAAAHRTDSHHSLCSVSLCKYSMMNQFVFLCLILKYSKHK